MSAFTIENSEAILTVDEHASEIHSFYNKETAVEAMWQGDPKYWSGRNPTLFPMVGKTWDGVLRIQGKEYLMGNHGFARHSEFCCIKHTDTQIVMELRDNEDTLRQYPFHFRLEISYTLIGKKVDIAYRIDNLNSCKMPFHFGLHPAFCCPVNPAGSFDDCYLGLNKQDHVNGILSDHIALDQDALAKTIIIAKPNSTVATLTDGSHGVQVEYHGYPWLAFWSPHAPFVCIEPWHSHTDFTKTDVSFEEREGVVVLDSYESWKTAYAITLF